MTFSADDLAAMAASYASRTTQAPIVVGHPRHDDPAWGWVTGLVADGDDLYAEVDQVPSEFAEQVRSGRYRHVSAALYGPDHKSNPTPGAWGLRHVGFLGAMPPAIKELERVELNETEEFTEVAADLVAADFHELPDNRDEIMADTPKPESVKPTEADGRRAEDRTAEFAERETVLTQREQELQEREDRLREQEEAARRAEHVAFAERLASEGRILPRYQETIVESLVQLGDTSAATVELGEGDDAMTVIDAFRAMLEGLPVQVEFGEAARAENGEDDKEPEFSAPAGYTVDTTALKLHRKALAHQKAHSVTYVEAVRAVS